MLQAFGSQALSNTLWALATLEQAPSQLWVTKFMHQAQQQLPHMNAQVRLNSQSFTI